jgi:hypothetical protein
MRSRSWRRSVAGLTVVLVVLALLAPPAPATTASLNGPAFGPRRLVAKVGGFQVVVPGGVTLSIQELAAGDLTGDGLADIVATRLRWASADTFPVTILVNDGRGGFSDGTAALFDGAVPRPQHPAQVLLADFNGDGRLDILVADTGQDVEPYPGYPNHLALSSSDGRYVNASGNLPGTNTYTHSAAAGDVDGDGDVDLFLGHFSMRGQPLEVLLNDGAGRFSVATDALPAESDGALVARSQFVDVDGDGALDLVLGGFGDDSMVLRNDGTGRFTVSPGALPPKPFAPDAINTAIRAVDLNGDARMDLLMAFTKGDPFYQGRWLQVLVNRGDGTFRDETATRLPQTGNPFLWTPDLVVDDLNGDGYVDIGLDLGATFGDPWLVVPPVFYLNRGDGTFAEMELVAFDQPPFRQFRWIDTNGDGRLDVFSAWQPPWGDPEEYVVSQQLAPTRSIEGACPAGVPDAGFTDIVSSQPHGTAIDCVAWWEITTGVSTGRYDPAGSVTRAQMATFVARLLERLGYPLPAAPADYFDDDGGSVHEGAVNQLAAIGVVRGKAPRWYAPDERVTRAQMATFLVRAVELATGQPMLGGPDAFGDDDGDTHEANIDRLVETGLALGVAPGRYAPNTDVRREQMATFIARVLDLGVELGLAQVGPDRARSNSSLPR